MSDSGNEAPQGFNWVGVILVVVVAVAVWFWFFIPTGGIPVEISREKRCRAQLRAIGMACMVYEAENETWPYAEGGSLATFSLLYDKYLEEPKLFACPESEDDAGALMPGGQLTRGMCSYTYMPSIVGVLPPSDGPADLIVAYERKAFHERRKISNSTPGRMVLYLDGRVELVKEPDLAGQLSKSTADYKRLSEKAAREASGGKAE